MTESKAKYLFKTLLISISTLLIFLSSCKEKVVYENYTAIKDNSWKTYTVPSSQKLKFDFEIIDTEDSYDVNIVLKHLPEIQYDDIYIGANWHYPNSENRYTKIKVKIKNKEGAFFGILENGVYTVKKTLKKTFNSTGTYKLELENYTIYYMENKLKRSSYEIIGLEEIGLLVERSK